jgi:succinyl-CoA synthetase beta subunit
MFEVDKDLALIEVNPLVITTEGKLHCLDAKIGVDSNACTDSQAA